MLDGYSCNTETEECVNALGSFECVCKLGFERTDNDQCMPTAESESDASNTIISNTDSAGLNMGGDTTSDTQPNDSQGISSVF